ncbi:hypothetical protein [Patulibacter sp. SYSU D01012]|uniref:hypothetical protein n=1 Tax=Patulibacter sp. SYSU D01012 TaxID=2817381 RepID=UPI001B300378|nr:hypothetical protein [Patulibacter sp. SYSU D01012]
MATATQDDVPAPDPFVPRDSPEGRAALALSRRALTSATRLVGAATVPVERVHRPATAGIPFTIAAAGGPSGAAMLRNVYRPRVAVRGSRVRVDDRFVRPRLTIVRPDGATQVLPAPVVALGPGDAPDTDAEDRRLEVEPDRGLPGGGWLARAFGSSPSDTTLTVIAPDGSARPVRSGGRAVTARWLAARLGAPRDAHAAGLGIVGHETSTRSAVVEVAWARRRPGRRSIVRDAVVRVPLDGTTPPSAIPGGADTAW